MLSADRVVQVELECSRTAPARFLPVADAQIGQTEIDPGALKVRLQVGRLSERGDGFLSMIGPSAAPIPGGPD